MNPTVRIILDRFLTRLDEVVDRCTDAIFANIPSYARLDDGFYQDVRDSVRTNLSILVEILSKGREVTRDQLEPIERAGARRADAAVPLEDVLHAYRTVSRISWDVLADECRNAQGDVLEASLALAETVLSYTDQISSAVADAYARQQRSIVREQEGARREFLADVLYGTDVAPEDILRRAHSFGYDLSLSYVALVGIGPGDDGRKEASVSAAASSLAGSSSADPIVLQKADHTIALIPIDPTLDVGTMPEKLVAELGERWRFGMGGPEPGLEGIRRAYLEAKEAIETGLALGFEGSVHRFNELLLYHFLRVEPALVDRFVEQTLGPLLEYDDRRNGELMRTLECYFQADGSVKAAGQLLFAHPHTVSYRLRQVEKLTGWSLRSAEDKLRLQLALRAYRLAKARSDG